MGPSGREGSRGARLFARLGRWIVRHPWYPIIFWVALLLVTVPFLSLIGSVTTNSTETLPSSAPSARANAEYATLFPNDTGGSSSIVLLYGANLTDPNAQWVVRNVTIALENDRSLTDVAGVSSVYTTYSAYLAGQAVIAGGVLGPGFAEFNASAELVWGPPTTFLNYWNLTYPHYPTPQDANYPAYEYARNATAGNSTAGALLDGFYGAFNTTPLDCAADPSTVVACTDAAARQGETPLLPTLFPADVRPFPSTALSALGVTNWTNGSSVIPAAYAAIALESGLPVPFLAEVWTAFPGTPVTPPLAADWANGTVAASTLWTEPLPVPHGISAPYVAPNGRAQVVDVEFTVADDSTNSSGGDPVYSDLGKIDALVGPMVTLESGGTILYVQTGTAPLDLLTQNSVNQSLSLVLPLTVGLLLAIAMVYFRSPVTPLVTFAALAIALVLALGGTVLVGTLVQHVDTTSLTLEEVFVLGVGTDYSIFLTARYREELLQGRTSEEAIVESLSWAGQSVATSGSTAIIATLALTFSGIALLSQWGSVLSLAILITLVLSLTTIPAFLKLLGPRIFWPMTGERFARHALKSNQRLRTESTYFYRVGRATQRRPLAVIAVIVLLSVPIVAVALSVPLSYDFYGQLPKDPPASHGLVVLGQYYGDGFAVPSFALVTFRAPLLVGSAVNATEFTDLAALTQRASNASGIAAVPSPVGPYGAPLATWLDFSNLPLAPQQNLEATLANYVGSDHRTVLLDLVPTSTGLSSAAVKAVRGVESSFASYSTGHPEITQIAYGGGAPEIGDLADSTSHATDYLIVAVTIGLILVLLVVLRSWMIALMAIATIGLSISWAWALTYLFFEGVLGFSLFFYVLTLLILLVLGLGIDYNIFVLTRVREERLRGRTSGEAAVEAVGRTGGIITAAAVILASAFAAVMVGSFTLVRAIGFSVAIAVILDAMVVRTYLVPASLQLLGDRVWSLSGRRRAAEPPPPPGP